MKTGKISVQQALTQGLAAYQAGRFAEAERICSFILQAAPRCFDALHLLAILKASSGHSEEADRLLKEALIVEPRSPEALNTRANVLHMLGRHEEAIACCTRALQLKPEFPEALNNRGNILRHLERYEEALASLDQALALRPDHATALNNRGVVLRDLKRPQEALACFDQALALEPNSAAALTNRASALHDLSRSEEALASVDRSLAISPEYAKALHNRGMILQSLHRFHEALECLDRALEIDPRFAEAVNRRAAILHELERYEEALTSSDRALKLKPDWPEALAVRASLLLSLQRFDDAMAACDRALSIRPDFAEALNYRGSVLRELNRWDEALACFDRAMALNPELVGAIFNHGVVLQDMQRPVEALNWIDRALAVKPNWPDALFERANALRDQQQYDAALATYDRVVSIKPDFAAAHWNTSLCRLLIGDLEGGWAKHDWRWRLDKRKSKLPNFGVPHSERPRWVGKDDLTGKTILLHAEQGFGDALQFCRYASLVRARGARVILEVRPELVTLMRSLLGVDIVIAKGQSAPPFDFQCPLLDLPGAFGTTLDTIPAAVPYVAPNPELAALWRQRVRSLFGTKIGIVWGGNPRLPDPAGNRVDMRRSIRLAQLAPLAPQPDIAWVSLQKGTPASQALTPPSGMALTDWTTELRDFGDTAALVQSLDLVITVDTSVAHLAGALGKPVWLLNRFDTCWRWLLDREDTPWYPTMRIFRQPSPGNWESVIQRVAAELPRWIAARDATTGVESPAPSPDSSCLVDK